jgi:hypothetical protein
MTKVTPVDASPNYAHPPGPVKKRACRDIFFLVLFGVYWIGMISLAIIAISNGDSRRIM